MLKEIKENLKKDFLEKLPPLVPRDKVYELTGGLISRKTLANLDSLGQGPKKRLCFGKKVCYPKEIFVEWLLERIDVYKNF